MLLLVMVVLWMFGVVDDVLGAVVVVVDGGDVVVVDGGGLNDPCSNSTEINFQDFLGFQ